MMMIAPRILYEFVIHFKYKHCFAFVLLGLHCNQDRYKLSTYTYQFIDERFYYHTMKLLV